MPARFDLAGNARMARSMLRERRIDDAVRGVMRLGRIPQGFTGSISVDRIAVAAWVANGSPLDSWWFAFSSAVGTFYRRTEAAAVQCAETRLAQTRAMRAVPQQWDEHSQVAP